MNTLARGVASPTAVAIAQKLKRICEIANIQPDKMIYDLHASYDIDPRTSESWFKKTDAIIRRKSRNVISTYCSTSLRIDLDPDFFTMTFASFDKSIAQKTTVDDKTITNDQLIPFPLLALPIADYIADINPIEIDYLAGKYQLYRYSFSGFDQITVELVTISRMDNTDKILRVVMYCHNVHDDKREIEPIEEFTGVMFRFGRMYNIVTSYSDKIRDRRIRFIQFPTLPTMRRAIHYGLVTGQSATLEEPVAARVIARKISNSAIIEPEDTHKVRRISPLDPEVRQYVEFLQTDPHAKEQRLMTVWKLKAAQIK